MIANRSRQALGNLRRPDILRPFLLVTANFMFVDKIHLFFSLLLFKDLTSLCLHLTLFSSSFVMFAGPFAMIFYGVQIFKETGSNIQIFKIFQCLNININITFDAGTNAHMAAISVAAIRVFGGLAAIFLMKRVPRLSSISYHIVLLISLY